MLFHNIVCEWNTIKNNKQATTKNKTKQQQQLQKRVRKYIFYISIVSNGKIRILLIIIIQMGKPANFLNDYYLQQLPNIRRFLFHSDSFLFFFSLMILLLLLFVYCFCCYSYCCYCSCCGCCSMFCFRLQFRFFRVLLLFLFFSFSLFPA